MSPDEILISNSEPERDQIFIRKPWQLELTRQSRWVDMAKHLHLTLPFFVIFAGKLQRLFEPRKLLWKPRKGSCQGKLPRF